MSIIPTCGNKKFKRESLTPNCHTNINRLYKNSKFIDRFNATIYCIGSQPSNMSLLLRW